VLTDCKLSRVKNS